MEKQIRVTLLFLFILFCIGCSESTQDAATVTATEKKPLSEPETVVVKFYTWYKDSIYENAKISTLHFAPDVVVKKDSTYDIESVSYINFLRKTDFFSEKFISNEEIKIDKCRNKINKVSAGGRKSTAGTTPYDKFPECTFLLFDNFVGGPGEDIEEIKIIHSTMNESTANVETDLGKLLPKLMVTLQKEGSDWKIDKIEELTSEQ